MKKAASASSFRFRFHITGYQGLPRITTHEALSLFFVSDLRLAVPRSCRSRASLLCASVFAGDRLSPGMSRALHSGLATELAPSTKQPALTNPGLAFPPKTLASLWHQAQWRRMGDKRCHGNP